MTKSEPYIILVEPQMAENIGMAARAMLNCGLHNMRLVNPRESQLSDKAISASSGADAILKNAEVFSSTAEAIADLQFVYASTARKRNQIKYVHGADFASSELVKKIDAGEKCGILFGPERTGLHNDDISLASAIIEIELNPEHCSLNLAQAVLLIGYEWHKHDMTQNSHTLVTNATHIAENEQLFKFFDFLEQKLEDGKNFADEQKKPRMMRNLRNIFSRAELTKQEIDSLYGIINHISNKKL